MRGCHPGEQSGRNAGLVQRVQGKRMESCGTRVPQQLGAGGAALGSAAPGCVVPVSGCCLESSCWSSYFEALQKRRRLCWDVLCGWRCPGGLGAPKQHPGEAVNAASILRGCLLGTNPPLDEVKSHSLCFKHAFVGLVAAWFHPSSCRHPPRALHPSPGPTAPPVPPSQPSDVTPAPTGPQHPQFAKPDTPKALRDPPAVVDGEHVLLEDLLGEDAVEDRGDAVDGLAGVSHAQDPVKPGKDEGEGGQRRGLGEHLDDGDVRHLGKGARVFAGSWGRPKPNRAPIFWVPGRAPIGERSPLADPGAPKFRAHHDHVLAEEAFDAPRAVADGEAGAVGDVRPRLGGVVAAVGNWGGAQGHQ